MLGAYDQRYDVETASFLNTQEDEKMQRNIRHDFIRKVYGILLTQIALTTCVTFFFIYTESVKVWLLTEGVMLTLLCTVCAIGLLIALICSENLRKNTPTNYILLFTFTLCESIGVGSSAVFLSNKVGNAVILQAFTLASAMMLLLTLFAFQTKYDFVSWAGGMFYVFCGVMLFGLCRLFFPRSRLIETVYSLAIIIIFSIYIIIDTQRLIGKKSVQLSIDEYILGALMLYVDYITLLLEIMTFLGMSQND